LLVPTTPNDQSEDLDFISRRRHSEIAEPGYAFLDNVDDERALPARDVCLHVDRGVDRLTGNERTGNSGTKPVVSQDGTVRPDPVIRQVHLGRPTFEGVVSNTNMKQGHRTARDSARSIRGQPDDTPRRSRNALAGAQPSEGVPRHPFEDHESSDPILTGRE